MHVIFLLIRLFTKNISFNVKKSNPSTNVSPRIISDRRVCACLAEQAGLANDANCIKTSIICDVIFVDTAVVLG